MDPTRRTFLAGVGAALVAAHAGKLPLAGDIPPAVPARVLPRLVPPYASGFATIGNLWDYLVSIGGQIEDLGPLNEPEREIITSQIDFQLNNLRPIGVQIDVEASPTDIAALDFSITERGPWHIAIVKGDITTGNSHAFRREHQDRL